MYNIPQEMIDEFNKKMCDISNNRDYKTDDRHISFDGRHTKRAWIWRRGKYLLSNK